MQTDFGSVCKLVYIEEYPLEFIALFNKLKSKFDCEIKQRDRVISVFKGFDRFDIIFPVTASVEVIQGMTFYHILRSGYGEIDEQTYRWLLARVRPGDFKGACEQWDDLIKEIECILKS